MTTPEQLRLVALQEFAANGYLGTSIARIAELAGVSKANVLYHYASKEALLAAAVEPAAEELRQIVDGLESGRLDPHEGFVTAYVDLLLQHRLEVHLVINQWVSLVDVPAIAIAHDLMGRLGEALKSSADPATLQMRIGIALAGSAYLLAIGDEFHGQLPADLRTPLVAVLTELLSPGPASAPADHIDSAVTAAGSVPA